MEIRGGAARHVYTRWQQTATEPVELWWPSSTGLPVSIDGRRLPLHELIEE